RVHQVGAGHARGHGQVGGDRLQGLVGASQQLPRPVGHGVRAVLALAVHSEVDELGQLTGQVLHVHARAAVDLGRVLPGEQGHPEAFSRRLLRRAGPGHKVTAWPLPTTVTPPGTSTFLSMIAFRTTACRPILVLCRMTERSTEAQLLIRTPGESTDSRARPPETITPLLTRLLTARPTRSPVSCTNFAGGTEGTLVRIGQRLL